MLSIHRRLAAARARQDKGFSLIELSVALGLFSLLTIILISTTVTSMRMASNVTIRTSNVSQAATGLGEVSKFLRTAVLPDQLTSTGGGSCTSCADTAVITASSTKIQFYANINNTGAGPSLVTFQIAADPRNPYFNLVEVVQPPVAKPDGTYTFCAVGQSGCTIRTRPVVRGLATATTPVFAYYDFSGDLIANDPLTADDLPTVDTIDITLQVQTSPGNTVKAPSTTLIQRVALPNADINVLVNPTPGPVA